LTHSPHGRTAAARVLCARRGVSAVTAFAVFAANLAPLAAPAAAQGIMSRADYEACQARDEASFRKAVEALTLKGLQTGLAGLDYGALVNEEWRRAEMDDTIDRQVDIAVTEVKQESSWGRLLQSLASQQEAQKLATSVADRTFRSEAIKTSLESMAVGMGKTIGKRIELATADTSEPAQTCIQAFLGPRYGSTISRVVARDAGKEFQIDPTKGSAEVSTGRVLAESAGGISGAVILLVRRQMANMASRVGARIVGSVLSRVVSVVAGGVGLVLIAKDIWDFRNGVLPIVAGEMKSRESKDKVKAELASAVQEQIGDNLKEISAKTADRVLEVWQEFRRAHARMLSLADENPRFKAFVESVKPEALGRLDEVIGMILASEGEAGILKRLDNGSLEHAVNRLSPAALDIAREQRSLEVALQWSAIAGDDLPKVLEYEIHRRAKPEMFTKASLAKLIAVGDRPAIIRLSALKPEARQSLTDLDGRQLRSLGRALDEAQLDGLARYLTGLDKSISQRILRAIADEPAKMTVLARPSVRDGIISSRDQAAAVAMMVSSDVVPDPWQVAAHTRQVIDGKVAPILLWERHPAFVIAAGVFALIMLAMMKRLVFGGRRPKVVVQRVEVPAASKAPPIKSARS
jgi:hypothetical protein